MEDVFLLVTHYMYRISHPTPISHPDQLMADSINHTYMWINVMCLESDVSPKHTYITGTCR